MNRFIGCSNQLLCYNPTVTEDDVIRHWRMRAEESLQVAKLTHEDGHYAHALFNCHLAVEKALKAQYMDERREEAPPVHDLFLIAKSLRRQWTKVEEEQLGYLTQYAVAARYDDPDWAKAEATEENSARWIAATQDFLSFLLP